MSDLFEPRPVPMRKKRRLSHSTSTTTTTEEHVTPELQPFPLHMLDSLLGGNSRKKLFPNTPPQATIMLLARMSTPVTTFVAESTLPRLVVSQGANPGVIVRPGYTTIVPRVDPEPEGRRTPALEYQPELHLASMALSAEDAAFFGITAPTTVGAFWKQCGREARKTHAANCVRFPVGGGNGGVVLAEDTAFPLLCALYENAAWRSPAFLALVDRLEAGVKLLIADGLVLGADDPTYAEHVRGYCGSPEPATVAAAFNTRDAPDGIGNALLAQNASVAFLLYILLLQRSAREDYPWRRAAITRRLML
jgi:hypothetical protein